MKLTKNLTKLTLLAFSLSLFSPIAHADWGIKASAANPVKRYKEPKDDAIALLGIQYQGNTFNLDKDGLSYDFANSEKYRAEVITKSNNLGFEASDSKTFTGMKTRKDSIDLGGRFIIETGLGSLVAEATKDVHASKGIEAAVRLGGITPHNQHWSGKREFELSPVIGVRYQDSDVIDYHYGVKGSEATANRKSYKGKSATTPFIGLDAQARINKHFTIDAGLAYEKRSNAVQNSPLTDAKKYDLQAIIGFTYWF